MAFHKYTVMSRSDAIKQGFQEDLRWWTRWAVVREFGVNRKPIAGLVEPGITWMAEMVMKGHLFKFRADAMRRNYKKHGKLAGL